MSQSRTPAGLVAKQIRVRIQKRDFTLRAISQREAARTWDLTRAFYRARRYRPAWTDGRGPVGDAGQFTDVLARAGEEGLDPRDYDAAELAADVKRLQPGILQEAPDATVLADLDLRLTFAYFRYGYHLLNGRAPREALDPEWVASSRKVDLPANLKQGLARHDIPGSLAELAPKDPRYVKLKEAWTRYADLAARGGWPAVPPGPPLRPGASGPRVEALARRLAAGGDLAGPATSSFDGRVQEAVRAFQARHGLEPTGVADATTVAALNIPVERRMRQIQMNLERWRWLPSDLGPDYIQVNIPDFRLDVMNGGRSVMNMKVVVGKRMSPTPMFTDRVVSVELNPYWNIPASIARNEILPAIAQDPDYLSRNHMAVVSKSGSEVVDAGGVDWSDTSASFPYALRQEPGPDNPLGRIKFVLPNEYDVYLHDTPAGHLFNVKERDFSHGCIRVEHPLELAEYLLQGRPEGSPERLEEMIQSGEHKEIPAVRKLPVDILYWTAWVDPNGVVEFRDDVYGHDVRLDAALRQGRMSSFRVNLPSQQPTGV